MIQLPLTDFLVTPSWEGQDLWYRGQHLAWFGPWCQERDIEAFKIRFTILQMGHE